MGAFGFFFNWFNVWVLYTFFGSIFHFECKERYFLFQKKYIFKIRRYIYNHLVCNAWINELKISLVMLLKVGLYRIKRENQFQRSNRFPIYLICTVVMFFSFRKKKVSLFELWPFIVNFLSFACFAHSPKYKMKFLCKNQHFDIKYIMFAKKMERILSNLQYIRSIWF